MSDAASIVKSGGGFVYFATGPAAYLGLSGTFGPMRQVAVWAGQSSNATSIIKSLSAAGFVTQPSGGGPEFPHAVSGVANSGISTNTPLTFWQTSTS